MSDSVGIKMARIGRAFGYTSDDLIKVRLGKINDELDVLRTISQQLAAKKLRLDMVDTPLRTLEAQRDASAGMKNDKRADALEKVKQDARAAVVAVTAAQAAGYVRKWDELIAVQITKATHFAKVGQQNAAKKDGDPTRLGWLVQPAAKLPPAIAKVQADKSADARTAFAQWDMVWGPFEPFATRYQDEVAGPPLITKSDQLKGRNPGSPEAAMEKLFGSDTYKRKLGRMAVTAEIYGQDISALDPGDALAIAEYSSSFFEAINPMLLGRPIPDADGKRTPQAKAIAAMAVAALKKLPAYTGAKFTMRGETDWPGAAKQFALGNVFTIPIFWSTGESFAFPGLYRLTVVGKSGKAISAFSDHPNETEVLYPPGTKFKVVKNQAFVFDDKTKAPKEIEVTVQEL